ncbi:glycosyltransferase family 2 protein [uncultured Methylophaga sp.]|uniref:glycosyltransferase family 2 protein n=1 Tax=uncultured Methylophaga sp. TaxID=285271 RepID=UPI0023B544DA|nr:glycosyltransferase family 2 protein [uncultured Methylophaga sp.]|tara:strand:- start:1768 stop:2733 length:966 start_codon:yes stop_codon:yes gene_type:complete
MNAEQLITILIPVYNEEDVLEILLTKLDKVTSDLPFKFEFLFVDDGSKDATVGILRSAKQKHNHIRILQLSRNFGKEAAITAGLHSACGDAVILMDADLQDPPEYIPEMIDSWCKGANVVLMKRRSRPGDGRLKKFSGYLFYRLIRSLSAIDIPADASDFRLMSREVVNAINQLPERNRYMKGIFAWVGMNTVTLEFDRYQRVRGKTKWSYLNLFELGVEGITSFTVKPLRLSTFVGLGLILFSFLTIIWQGIFPLENNELSDHHLMAIAFFFGLQFLFIGLIGEYIGKIYIESKHRPIYILQENNEGNGVNLKKTKVEFN